MRILVLASDAFGGYGGIAKYNRDLIGALCTYPGVAEVVAIPRRIPCLWSRCPPGSLTLPAGETVIFAIFRHFCARW